MSIIITIINNITVLVSHSVICFGYFMCMSHDVSIRRLFQLSTPTPSPLTKFSPGLSFVLQEIVYQTSSALIRLLQKNNAF